MTTLRIFSFSLLLTSAFCLAAPIVAQESAESIYRQTVDDVVGRLESRLRDQPNDPANVYYLGLALRDSRRLSTARATFEKAHANDRANTFIAGALSITAAMKYDAADSSLWARRAAEHAKSAEKASWIEYAEKNESYVADCDSRRRRQFIVLALAALTVGAVYRLAARSIAIFDRIS